MDNNERDQIIAKHLAEGTSLSDVQKILESEHNCRIKYMELRLIAADLEVNWEKIDGPKVEPEAESEVEVEATLEPDAAIGGTQISVSKIVRPGAVMSGDVTFKSGKRAEWFLDQLGRLGLNPTDGSGEPDEDDLQDFQVELQRALQGNV